MHDIYIDLSVHAIFQAMTSNGVCLLTLFILGFFGGSSARGGGGAKGPPFHRILYVNAIETKFGTHVYHVIL